MEKQKSKSLLFYAGSHKIFTYLACVLSGISAIIALFPFVYIWKVVDEIINVMPNLSQAQNLTRWGYGAVISSLVSMLIYFLGLIFSHISAFRTAKNMKSMALHHLVKLPLGYFSNQTSGRLRRIIDESADMTEGFLAHQLPDLIGALITPIAAIVLMFTFDWRLGLVSLIPLFIGFLFLCRMTGEGMKKSMLEYQNSLEDMNSQAVEYVRGIPVVKTFSQSVFSFKRFHESIKKYHSWVVKYTLSLRIPMCSYTASINAIFAFLIPAGILLAASAVNYKMFLSHFIFYILFTPFCTVMINRVMWVSEKTMSAKDAQSRIESILNEKPLEEASIPKKPLSNDITFENVTFSYAGSTTPAVKNVSFSVKEGQTVALVGPSGGGKSTVASLIPRFWDVTSGSVKIGGIDVREISTTELMDRVSFVFQDTRLFKASILDNIRTAKPQATEAEVLAAAKAAQCDDIIEKFPKGLNTVVGTKGVYLSGGEVQRITLARAILKDAPIVILDEATAFADPENESKIQEAFKILTKGKTVLMIAHRLSTIQNTDQIYVLSNGEIKERGKHKELLKQDGIYASMWKQYETSVQWKITKKGAIV